jgi:hypothetical protein
VVKDSPFARVILDQRVQGRRGTIHNRQELLARTFVRAIAVRTETIVAEFHFFFPFLCERFILVVQFSFPTELRLPCFRRPFFLNVPKGKTHILIMITPALVALVVPQLVRGWKRVGSTRQHAIRSNLPLLRYKCLHSRSILFHAHDHGRACRSCNLAARPRLKRVGSTRP